MVPANRVCRFVCRFSAAKYDIWGYQLRQVAAFHREITAFCRYSVLFFNALQVRAFDHSATCPNSVDEVFIVVSSGR